MKTRLISSSGQIKGTYLVTGCDLVIAFEYSMSVNIMLNFFSFQETLVSFQVRSAVQWFEKSSTS